MGKNNGSPKSAAEAAELVEEVVKEVAPAAPVMTVVKSEPEEAPRKLTLDEKIRRVEEQINL
jgi:hypothetical protein